VVAVLLVVVGPVYRVLPLEDGGSSAVTAVVELLMMGVRTPETC
jgi:hypothetical protein